MSTDNQRSPRRTMPAETHQASLVGTLGFMVAGLMACAAYAPSPMPPQQDDDAFVATPM